MVDLMSHVFSPRDIQEKWVGHVDFQLPSKCQKPSGKKYMLVYKTYK